MSPSSLWELRDPQRSHHLRSLRRNVSEAPRSLSDAATEPTLSGARFLNRSERLRHQVYATGTVGYELCVQLLGAYTVKSRESM